MNEIRNNFLYAFSIVPIIFVLPQIKNASFIFLQSSIKEFNPKNFPLIDSYINFRAKDI